MPKICNPVLSIESFTRHWDQDKYRHFREMFDLYNTKINEAIDSKEHNTSIKSGENCLMIISGSLRITPT